METIVGEMTLQVQELLERGRIAQAIDLIESLPPADQADIFEDLPLEQQEALLSLLENEEAADILEELEDDEAAELAARIDADVLAPIVDEMAPDEAADLLGDLGPSHSTDTLAHMLEADEVEPLLLHPDETAGGLMTSEYLAFPQNMQAHQVLAALRTWEPKGVESPYLSVVDRQGHLTGVVSLFQILRASHDAQLASLMDTQVFKVHQSDDQETAARLMARYDLIAVPVVDDDERVVGVITVDDLVEVLEDEATEDIQRIAGSEPLYRPYLAVGVVSVVRKRLGWLLLLFITSTLTGTVMRFFEDQIAQVIVLTVFVPLLIGMGGNVGSQSSATIIRALAVGDIRLKDTLRIVWRELLIGLMLGALLSIAAYVRAVTWDVSPAIGFVVAASALFVVVWANCVGAFLPLLSEKLHIDPTLLSAPLLDTIVDGTGLLIYFSIARIVLGI